MALHTSNKSHMKVLFSMSMSLLSRNNYINCDIRSLKTLLKQRLLVWVVSETSMSPIHCRYTSLRHGVNMVIWRCVVCVVVVVNVVVVVIVVFCSVVVDCGALSRPD